MIPDKITETDCENVNGFELAKDRVQWHAFVNTTMNLRVHDDHNRDDRAVCMHLCMCVRV
jgi:hypothetical protein